MWLNIHKYIDSQITHSLPACKHNIPDYIHTHTYTRMHIHKIPGWCIGDVVPAADERLMAGEEGTLLGVAPPDRASICALNA
jgi:hypothetical protein